MISTLLPYADFETRKMVERYKIQIMAPKLFWSIQNT